MGFMSGLRAGMLTFLAPTLYMVLLAFLLFCDGSPSWMKKEFFLWIAAFSTSFFKMFMYEICKYYRVDLNLHFVVAKSCFWLIWLHQKGYTYVDNLPHPNKMISHPEIFLKFAFNLSWKFQSFFQVFWF